MTLQSFYKSSSQKESSKKSWIDQIEKIEEEIETYLKVINICESHIAKFVIPYFKKTKKEIYYKILQMVSVNEIHNWQMSIGFWKTLPTQTQTKEEE